MSLDIIIILLIIIVHLYLYLLIQFGQQEYILLMMRYKVIIIIALLDSFFCETSYVYYFKNKLQSRNVIGIYHGKVKTDIYNVLLTVLVGMFIMGHYSIMMKI